MFPVEKLTQFESTNASYRILKPWWDVFTDYLSAVMLILALSAGALQVLQGDLICLPAAECNFNLSKVSNDQRNGNIPVSTSFLRTNRSFCQKYYASATRDSRMTVIALTKLEDRRQYDFVDAQCGQEAVHWFASYLPFILFLQAVILVIVDNFWLKFPKTSSTMDHFVKLVLECFNSSGTCLDVSNVLWGTIISEDTKSNATKDIEQDTGERHTLLRNKTEKDAPSVQIPSTQSDRDSTSALDLSEAIKATTLCEKIRHFQEDVENQNHQFLVRIYLAQAVMQCVFSLASLIVNSCFYRSVRSTVKCDIDDIGGAIYGHYNYFKCSYAIAVYFRLTLIIFNALIALYFLLCVFIFAWTLSKFKKPFTFKEIDALKGGDIRDVKGDLAFMLHLLNNYNKLYLYRFAVFLSQKNEKKLKDFILSKEWPLDKLKRMTTENGTKLGLNGLTGIPNAIFQLSELESLTLEDCSLTEEDFDSKDWPKLELRSLLLVKCCLKSIPKAIVQNCQSENGTFTDLNNNNNNNKNGIPKAIFQLSKLKSLTLEDCSLTEEDFHSEDWQNLELRSLSLVKCGLTSIPKAIFQNCESLKTLDLSNNRITSVPENIAALHYLHTLSFAGNKVTEGVEHILKINSLQVLNLRENNSLQNVPDQIASHPRLSKLYVDETVVSNMSEEMKTALEGVIDTGRPSPGDVTVIEYSPSRAPYIEEARKDGEKVYKMTSKPKGLALIFNFVFYERASNRSRSSVDAERLDKLFTGIGYNVKVRGDSFSAMGFKTELSDLLTNFATGDSVVVAMLARASNKGVLCCDGGVVSVDEIVSIVGNVDNYLDKPKLIFIPAFCGDYRAPRSVTPMPRHSEPIGSATPRRARIPTVDGFEGSRSVELSDTKRDSDSLTVSKPAYSDVLIGYFTPPDSLSYQNPRNDSYIQSLVKVFSRHAFDEDVLSLLTFVKYKESRKFKTMHGFRQMPAPQSTLTKKLFFLPGYFEDDDYCSAASTSTQSVFQYNFV